MLYRVPLVLDHQPLFSNVVSFRVNTKSKLSVEVSRDDSHVFLLVQWIVLRLNDLWFPILVQEYSDSVIFEPIKISKKKTHFAFVLVSMFHTRERRPTFILRLL